MIPSPGRRAFTAIRSASVTSGARRPGPSPSPRSAGRSSPAPKPNAARPRRSGSAEHALAGRDLLDVRAPQLVRAGRPEVALDQIRPHPHPVHAEHPVPAVTTALGRHVRALDALHAHQPLDPLEVHRPALAAQLGVHATGPVGPVAFNVHTTDLDPQRSVRLGPLRRRPARPRVIARARHPQHPAHRRDSVVRLLRLDEPEHRYRVSCSLAKKAAAFLGFPAPRGEPGSHGADA